MPATVIVNNMTVVHRGSNGIATVFPDVCKTPSPGGPVPIPYPNVAMSQHTAQGSKTVKMDGNPIMLKSSNYMTSTGNEAGSALGVVSNRIKGKAYPKMFSFDVKADGANVFRLLDIMLQNGASPTNTPPGPNMQPPNAVLPDGDPDLMKLTTVKWEKTEACCGDEIGVEVKAENMDGVLTVIKAVRTAAKHFKIVGQIFTLIDGTKGKDVNGADLKWKVLRGPHLDEVKLEGWGRGLGGPKDSAGQLLVKTPPEDVNHVQKTYRGDAMQFMDVPGQGWSWQVTAANYYAWNVDFEMKIDDGELVVTKKVNFHRPPHPQNGVVAGSPSSDQLRRWKQDIENVWDLKFKIHREECTRGDRCRCVTCGGCMFPIRIKCEWSGGHGDRVALMYANPTNALRQWGAHNNQPFTWWTSHCWWQNVGPDSSSGINVRPHEFGHLIGLYDEYQYYDWQSQLYTTGAAAPGSGGGTDYQSPAGAPESSIMYSGGDALPQHMLEFKQWFDGVAGPAIGRTKLLAM